MDASIAALLGAFIGAAAGVIAQVITAAAASRHDRRRLAFETGYREWEKQHDLARERGGANAPPILFAYYNLEILRMLESRDGLTPEAYRNVNARYDRMYELAEEETERRRKIRTNATGRPIVTRNRDDGLRKRCDCPRRGWEEAA